MRVGLHRFFLQGVNRSRLNISLNHIRRTLLPFSLLSHYRLLKRLINGYIYVTFKRVLYQGTTP